MGRIEHYNDPAAPRPNRLIPAASAVVADGQLACAGERAGRSGRPNLVEECADLGGELGRL